MNLAIWRRSLSPKLVRFVEALARRAGKLEHFSSLEHTQSVAGILPDWALALEGADYESCVTL